MLKFKKMHGNGNDFIVIENLTEMHALSKSQLIKMGDRKKGLGFDQLITINPPINSKHDFYVKHPESLQKGWGRTSPYKRAGGT